MIKLDSDQISQLMIRLSWEMVMCKYGIKPIGLSGMRGKDLVYLSNEDYIFINQLKVGFAPGLFEKIVDQLMNDKERIKNEKQIRAEEKLIALIS